MARAKNAEAACKRRGRRPRLFCEAAIAAVAVLVGFPTTALAWTGGFTSPAAGDVVTPGQTINILWTGGDPSWSVALYLVDVEAWTSVVQVAGPISNSGSFSWTFPSTLPFGGPCGRAYLFYVGNAQRTDWTYGPAFTAVCDVIGPATSNVAPAPNPVSVGAAVDLTAFTDDSSSGDSIIAAAEYAVDGGAFTALSASDGTFDSVAEDVTGSLGSFGTAGIYEVCIRATDEWGNIGPSECAYLAVYDPSAGFVTGGGWIQSPSGAYTPDNGTDADLVGKASFGFVSKYQRGASIPTGSTEFQFRAADLNFKSTSYGWLVIAGSSAKFRGEGTVNGEGSHAFMVTAGDGSPDTFRIRMWDKPTGEVLYDNGANTPLGGGSIVIHAK